MSIKIKLLGLCASPRKGNSAFLLDKSLEEVSCLPFDVDTTLYSFQGKQIQPCLSCFACMKTGKCIINDDFEELRQLWINSDVIIYSFPVYHLSIPGQLKAFLDRLGNAFFGYYPVASVRHLKVMGFLSQGMHYFGGQELAINNLVLHSILLNCIPVSGDGWQSYIGACGWTENSLDYDSFAKLKKEENRDLAITLTAAKSVVKRAIEMSAIVKKGVSQLQEKLSVDKRYRPYIERMNENH